MQTIELTKQTVIRNKNKKKEIINSFDNFIENDLKNNKMIKLILNRYKVDNETIIKKENINNLIIYKVTNDNYYLKGYICKNNRVKMYIKYTKCVINKTYNGLEFYYKGNLIFSIDINILIKNDYTINHYIDYLD